MATMTQELTQIQVRTRKAVGMSGAAHLAFFLWLLLTRHLAPEPEVLTEIRWIDPVEQVQIAAVVPAPQEEAPPPPPQEAPAPVEKQQEPDPREIRAAQDKLATRLAALQRIETQKPLDIASVQGKNPVKARLAGASPNAKVARPKSLARETSAPSPTPLRHAPPSAARAGLAQPLPDVAPERAKPERSDTETYATRSLAGTEMTGPVADRPIISYETPTYPEWAKDEGVEGTVVIYFVVRPDGRVKENVMVQKTSGFGDFDENAVDAILAWKFEPLKQGQTGEQWGTIVFHYRLE